MALRTLCTRRVVGQRSTMRGQRTRINSHLRHYRSPAPLSARTAATPNFVELAVAGDRRDLSSHIVIVLFEAHPMVAQFGRVCARFGGHPLV